MTPLYRCPECGHLCTCGEHRPAATFNRRRSQYGRCGQTYTEPEAKR